MWLVDFGQSHDAWERVFVDEWRAAYDAWIERQNRDYVIGGTIVAAIYNTNRKPNSRALGPADVYPHLTKNQRVPEGPRTDALVEKMKAALGYPGRKT